MAATAHGGCPHQADRRFDPIRAPAVSAAATSSPSTSPNRKWRGSSHYEVLKALATATARPPDVADIEQTVQFASGIDEEEGKQAEPLSEHDGPSSEQDLAALRKVVQTDDRFGKILEGCASSLPQVMKSGSKGEILGALAGLVWQSLRLLWELEPGRECSKGRMKSQLTSVEKELEKQKAEFESCRCAYLKELMCLRDQLRGGFDRFTLDELRKVVYEERPVMFYEPLMFLDEHVREHVAVIVEEKIKAWLCRQRSETGEDSILQRLVANIDAAEKRIAELEASEAALKELVEEQQEAEASADGSPSVTNAVKRSLWDVMAMVRKTHPTLVQVYEHALPDAHPPRPPPAAEHRVLFDQIMYLVDFMSANSAVMSEVCDRWTRADSLRRTETLGEQDLEEQLEKERSPDHHGQSQQARPSFSRRQGSKLRSQDSSPQQKQQGGSPSSHGEEQSVALAAAQAQILTQDGEIKQLKETIKQMKRQANTPKAFSHLPKWRSPTTNVFDRLHQDSCLRLASSKPRPFAELLADACVGQSADAVAVDASPGGHSEPATVPRTTAHPSVAPPTGIRFDDGSGKENSADAAGAAESLCVRGSSKTSPGPEGRSGSKASPERERSGSKASPERRSGSKATPKPGSAEQAASHSSTGSGANAARVPPPLGSFHATDVEHHHQKHQQQQLRQQQEQQQQQKQQAGKRPASPHQRRKSAVGNAAATRTTEAEVAEEEEQIASPCDARFDLNGPANAVFAVHGTAPPSSAGTVALATASSASPAEELRLQPSFRDPFFHEAHHSFALREAKLLARITQLETTLERERQHQSTLPRLALKDPRLVASLLTVQQQQAGGKKPLGQWFDELLEQTFAGHPDIATAAEGASSPSSPSTNAARQLQLQKKEKDRRPFSALQRSSSSTTSLRRPRSATATSTWAK